MRLLLQPNMSIAYSAVCTFTYDGNETLGDVRTVTEENTLILYESIIYHIEGVGE